MLTLTRREFIELAALAAVWPYGCAPSVREKTPLWVNDVQSQLNRTRVAERVGPTTVVKIQDAIRRAAREGMAISVAGGRHAMGGQQFGTDTMFIDMTDHDDILAFDPETGIIEVEAGIQWPALVDFLLAQQEDAPKQWSIAQKQTGTDRLSIGGTLAANAHGRGLNMKPFVSNVESFDLVGADGEVRRCSRTENVELFRLAIGGYGLFGVVASVRLRLVPRQKLERIVEVIDVGDLAEAFARRKREGFLFGDCQYAIDETSPDYLRKGVFSCYRPVDPATPIPQGQARLSPEDWTELIYLAHTNKGEAFKRYSTYYLSTSGQIYRSDLHQLSTYMDDYHRVLDKRLGGPEATEIISEIYVPLGELAGYLDEVREDFKRNNVNVIYGTIRLIEQDDETFLAWARQPYACIIFNLHTVHSPEGIKHSADAFRSLIDLALLREGSYYLTYHRFARKDQVVAAYPQFVDFLKSKRRYDPAERFQSDWYRHYRDMFAEAME
jgi:FAD/FMN-containing dehydrogenase